MVNYQNNTVVLNFSSTDNGGAGEASYKFHMNLNKIGFESFLFVARKTKKNKKIFNVKNNLIYKLQSKISQIKNYLNITNIDYSFLDSGVNFEINSKKIRKIIKKKKIKCIIVHSVPNFLDFKNILKLKNEFNCEIYFRLYDMQNFSGGCSYSLGCDGYKKTCSECPGINNFFFKGNPNNNLLEKRKLIKFIKPKILASSYFEMQRSKESSIFNNLKHYNIPLGVDPNIFKQTNFTKKRYNDKTIFLLGTSDLDAYRKGLIFFLKALKANQHKDKIKIITIGAKKNYFKALNVETENFNYTRSQKLLNKVFNKSHFCIIPSIDETGPTMLNMAMMASIPCITFNIGDALKHVKNNITGYKCDNKDIINLAKNIDLAINTSHKKLDLMKYNSRKVALKAFADKTQISIMKKIIK